jgi:hypothetical protein
MIDYGTLLSKGFDVAPAGVKWILLTFSLYGCCIRQRGKQSKLFDSLLFIGGFILSSF